MSGAKVVRALRHFGFEVVATRGSHAKLRRATPDGQRQTLTIPLHDSLATGTIHAILRQASRYVPVAGRRPFFFTSPRA